MSLLIAEHYGFGHSLVAVSGIAQRTSAFLEALLSIQVLSIEKNLKFQ